jgi:hypothetical protein
MSKLLTTILLATATFVPPRLAAAAGPILDQSYVTPGFEADVNLFDILGFAQTFTVGISGTLSRVDVQIYKHSGATDEVTLTILDTVAGVPNQVLFQTLVAFNEIPTIDNPFLPVPFTSVDTAAWGAQLFTGQTLAIDVRRTVNIAGPGVLWRTDIGGTYAGGDQFQGFGYLSGTVDWTPVSAVYDGLPVDGGFQTWIEAAVPEPAGLFQAAALIALSSLGARRNPANRKPPN